MEDRLQFFLYDRDRAVYILPLLIYLPTEADPVLKKKRGKKNLISLSSSNSEKIILTLLTDIVALYVGLSVIHV